MKNKRIVLIFVPIIIVFILILVFSIILPKFNQFCPKFYGLNWFVADDKLSALPDGYIKDEYDPNYYIPITSSKCSENINTTQKIKMSLDELFNYPFTNSYVASINEIPVSTYIFANNVSIEVNEEDGKYIINFKGQLRDFNLQQWVGDSDHRYMKKQIIYTIEQYTSNYQILLNNSEKEFTLYGAQFGG
jgi:hypothetical protein